LSSSLLVLGALGLVAGCGSDPAPTDQDSGTDVGASTDTGPTPDMGTTPDVPSTPDVPTTPDVPGTPDVPATPDVPVATDVPETPDVPVVPDVPETPDVPVVPDVPETPDVPVVPDVPETPDVPMPPVDAGPMCGTNEVVCAGACVDTRASRDHCGACGNVCGVSQLCVNGTCTLLCPMGQVPCGQTCHALQSDNAHCGACNNACGTGQNCINGACASQCPAGQTNCGGACVNLQTNAASCGACGTACMTGQVCRAGACVAGCSLGLNDCQGACRDFQSDSAHCGACGNACGTGTYCAAGVCVTDRCAGVSCPASSACHTANLCDRATGMCRQALDVTVSAMGASALIGPRGCTTGYTSPQCSFQTYDARGNFAAQANNGGIAAVASGTLGTDMAIHQPQFANDGRYGNGASWIPAAANNWVKIDLGRSVAIDTITFGRDRLGGVTDRPGGRYTVYVATADAVYANGNDANDATEYRRVYDSSVVAGRGETIPTGQTVTARFAPVLGRFVKIAFANAGVAIDEVEVRGCDPATTTCAALPTGNGMACTDGLGGTTADVCADGACVGTACATGLGDCDGNRANACEVDTRTNANHCGACGNACGAGRVCESSACRTLHASCQAILAATPSSPSGRYWVAPTGPSSAAEVYCDMATAGGGWTLALKANGANTTFAYDAALWTNTALLNPTSLDTTPTDAKFASFLNQPVTQVLVVMTAGGMSRSAVIDASAANLAALVSGTYRATTLGRTAWLGLLPGQTIQPNCNREGFSNSFADPHARVRIGILGNQENDCGSTDSWLGVGGNPFTGNPCFGTEARPSVGQMGGGTCTPGGATVTATAQVYVRSLPRNCQDLRLQGSTTNGVATVDPDGAGPVPATQVYCDQTTDGGGWTLVGRLGDPRYLPQLDRNLGAITAPAGVGNILHTQYAALRGSAVRVGRMVGTGTTVGNFFEINDCSTGDAACWYGRFLNQNDGDTFGAWLTAGGNWGFVPTGCGADQCPTTSGDRDHSQAQRIAIFGGDCHASCSSNGDIVRNGFTYRDYGTALAPVRVGNRGWWGAGTVTSGATPLGSEIPIVDYGQGGTAWRDLWIR